MGMNRTVCQPPLIGIKALRSICREWQKFSGCIVFRLPPAWTLLLQGRFIKLAGRNWGKKSETEKRRANGSGWGCGSASGGDSFWEKMLGIIERGRGSGSELFNQKGGELKGEIKMFLRFPDGFSAPAPRPLEELGFLSLNLCLPSPPPKNLSSLGAIIRTIWYLNWGEKVKRNKSIFLCMLKRTSHPNKSIKLFPDVCKIHTHTIVKSQAQWCVRIQSYVYEHTVKCMFSCKSPKRPLGFWTEGDKAGNQSDLRLGQLSKQRAATASFSPWGAGKPEMTCET